ncbi:MAG: cytochrome P460 family protein, partial [Deltaproteobacteria bacterium]|nr:cytochrome P460 family protein [Deltaproteobacteria bacterium]
YVNDAAFKAITGKKGKFPDGAMIAQDNFSKDKKLMNIDVMYKVKGYNPKEGDWFWVQFRTDGRIISEGKIDECIKCHVAQKGNDYVYTTKMK